MIGTERRTLRNRRHHDIVEFEHQGISYRAGIGHFDDGSPAEVFLEGGKLGSTVRAHSRDAAVILSLSLQHGTPLNTIRHALLKLPNGAGAGPIGALLDVIEGANG